MFKKYLILLGLFCLFLFSCNLVNAETFGNSEYSAYAGYADDVKGTHGYSPASDGMLQNITARLKDASGDAVTLAIYDQSDFSLVATSETRTDCSNSETWETFDLTSPVAVYSSKTYCFAFYSATSVSIMYKNRGIGVKDTRPSQNNIGGLPFPDPVSTSYDQYDFSIYGSYTVGLEDSNNDPVQSGISPPNETTNVNLTPNLYVLCTDVDSNNTMNATWQWNNSGEWVTFATNNSIANNTNITQTNSNFSSYSTTYYWRVNLSDGYGGWDNQSYSFTTIDEPVTPPNYPVNFSNENPSNNSIDQELSLIWNITMIDDNGDTFNWTIECNNSQSNNSNNDNNGSKQLSLSGLSYSTTYTVYVNATDNDTVYTRHWYKITTKSAPDTTNPTQTNNATSNITITWSINLSDDSGLFNYTIECNNSQSVSENDASNGTKNIFLSNLVCNTTYTLWVNVTDYSKNWNNQSYNFTLCVCANSNCSGGNSSYKGYLLENTTPGFDLLTISMGMVFIMLIRKRRNR